MRAKSPGQLMALQAVNVLKETISDKMGSISSESSYSRGNWNNNKMAFQSNANCSLANNTHYIVN